MGIERYTDGSACREEIETAIDRVKRTKLDRWMRKEWHKASARDQWSESRKAKWDDWREEHSCTPARVRSDRSCAMQSKVWVKGRVPKEFLDWAERYWSHDDGTRVMLSGCCFEEWER